MPRPGSRTTTTTPATKPAARAKAAKAPATKAAKAPATKAAKAPATKAAKAPAKTPVAPRPAAPPGARVVDFVTVSTEGLASSPHAAALAGLRANEARYYKTKYGHVFTVTPAADAKDIVDWVHGVLAKERQIVIASRPLEATRFEVDGIRMAYVFYESGLSINVMYTLADAKKRAVGFKLSDGMPVPDELATRFKFASMKSKLAGTIRGSFFVIKGEH